jgi:DNA-binding transcriptional ArsR family regulator
MPESKRPRANAVTPAALAEAERARDAFFANITANRVKQVSRPPAPKPQKTDENYSTNRLTIESSTPILNHMVEYPLDATFHALSDPTRRGMLASLASGEKSVGELAQPFSISFAGAAKHVKVLEGAGLVARRKVGRTQLCSLNAEPLAQAEQWLRQWERFWNVRLDALEALIQAGKERKR